MLKKVRLALSKADFRLWLYIISSFAIVVFIEGVQYSRYNMFGTDLLLGWDTPGYVWVAKQILLKGPMSVISAWSYPNLYPQMLAFFGFFTNDVIMVERIFPLFFFLLLIYINSRIVLKITHNVAISGLTALLTAISINALRLFADLHRNLMALSLSFVAIYLVSKLDEESTWNKRSFFLLLLLLSAIASAQFETFGVLCASLVLYGIFSKNPKKLMILTSVCAIPTVSMALLLPTYFFGYINTVYFTGQHMLAFNEVLRWTGGSWIHIGCLVIAAYSFFTSTLRKNKLAQLIFSWSSVIFVMIVSVGLGLVHLSPDFAVRAMFVIPLPVLLALASSICINFVKSLNTRSKASRVCRRLVLLIPICLIVVSVVVASQNFDEFLTPYISRERYEKIMITKTLFIERRLSMPVFVFYGYPAFWYFTLDRNYVGMEIGEHFAYYGTIENLLRLIPSEPYSSDPYMSQIEKQWATIYFNELTGNSTWPPPPHHIHESYIRSVKDLMSHPIIVVSPEFYNDKIPYFLKPFYVNDGIYIIPPNSSIDPSKITYGPEVTVIKNSTLTQVKSEYTYIDPINPSIIYIKVNASSGYAFYNFTDFPSSWTFQKIEQDGDLSFPENDPRRINDVKAYSGNDPADSLDYWSLPVPQQNGTSQIDTLSKKEGFASLKVSGKIDPWNNLGVRYNAESPGAWNLAGYSSIGVWVKCSESAPFSMTFVDRYQGSRTFWAIEAEGSSATTSWKRLVVNLTEYTSQTPDFRINSVDYINLYIYSTVGKNLSFWIDDLTVDTTLNLHSFVYKDRVPIDETVIAYFYTHIEDGQ